MLTIRDAQLSALIAPRIARFRSRAVDHIRTALRGVFDQLGEEAVTESVDRALAKARQYGIADERDIVRYLNLMYFLGFDFDSDPFCAWAREILEDRATPAPERLDSIAERVGLA